MEKTEILKIEHLDAGYRDKKVVSDISACVHPGEILTLIGPNGAGKSTILRTLIHELAPKGGAIYLDFQEMGKMSAQDIARRMSILTTSAIKTELMSCEDIVSTGRYPYTGRLGILSEKDHEVVRSAMKRVNVEELAKEDFTCISDGQRQRVLLARAICQEPEVLIMDEPTSFLDIHHKLELIALLKNLVKEQQLAVVMSMHELDLAQKCSDTILCIKEGKLDKFGTPEEIFKDSYISELYEIEHGSYHSLHGSIELQKADAEPEVFVIGGMGLGISVYRYLQRQQIPFSCGILWENDLDVEEARVLASRILLTPAFLPVEEELLKQAKEEIDRVKKVILALPKEKLLGHAQVLKGLAEYAGEKLVFWRGEEYGI